MHHPVLTPEVYRPRHSTPPPTHRDAAGADQYRPASHPYPLGQPELFYIADGDGQGFRDDDSQQAFPDYD
jgi:hypothetical protein